jgi:hypothetical protein
VPAIGWVVEIAHDAFKRRPDLREILTIEVKHCCELLKQEGYWLKRVSGGNIAVCCDKEPRSFDIAEFHHLRFQLNVATFDCWVKEKADSTRHLKTILNQLIFQQLLILHLIHNSLHSLSIEQLQIHRRHLSGRIKFKVLSPQHAEAVKKRKLGFTRSWSGEVDFLDFHGLSDGIKNGSIWL